MEFAFQCGKFHLRQGIVRKGQHEQGACFRFGDSAGTQVKESVCIQLSYGAPVRTLDVVGKNLQLRLGIDLRTIVQQQVIVLLIGEGLLCLRTHHDLPVEHPVGTAVVDSFVHLVAGAMGYGVVHISAVVHVFVAVDEG